MQSFLQEDVFGSPKSPASVPSAGWLSADYSNPAGSVGDSAGAYWRRSPLSPLPAATADSSQGDGFLEPSPHSLPQEETAVARVPEQNPSPAHLAANATPPSARPSSSPAESSSSSSTDAFAGLTSPDEPPPHSSSRHAVPVLELHRRANAQRRQRESEALRRLEELSEDQAYDPLASSSSSTRHKRQKRSSRNKLSVLQASAERIQQLERMLFVAEQQKRAADAATRRVNTELSAVLQNERHGLQWLDSTRSLHSSTLLDDRFSLLLVEWRTGKALHANSRFYAVTGFTPSGILQRSFAPPPGCRLAPQDCEPPLVRQRKRSVRTIDAAEQWEWVPRPKVSQYPSSLLEIKSVMLGERASCYVPTRSRCLDATYEVQTHVWMVDSEFAQEEDGRKWRRPLTYMLATTVDEYRRLDEDDLSLPLP